MHKLFWGSSYDRGLDILLYMWSDIIRAHPDAELHIAYGWQTFNAITRGNPERLKWKKTVQKLMQQKGVFHYGRLNKEQLTALRYKCGIWAYPTYFTEINCLTALECQRDGVVPVTMDFAALKETIGAGVKVRGDITDPRVQQKYLEELLAIMGDERRWLKEVKKGKKFAKQFYFKNIVRKWSDLLERPFREPLVSVITITIREGWWRIMAENLSRQTYKNFEWIILDDYPKDRGKTADRYAQKYGLNIRYIRGDKVLGKYDRTLGLVRANNKAWKSAKGELLVWLQDFILIKDYGVELLVDLYRHHPNALLAPTDDYWYCKKPNLDNKEDWWDGKTDVLAKHSWRNIRNQFLGIRKTDNPFDFEMNWSATPKHIVDKLNGWWEFFDNGLGFDNSELALRALKAGYKIIIDDRNVAACIDLWPVLAGTKQNIENRERLLAVPYWIWLKDNVERGVMPPVRDDKTDSRINLKFSVPKSIKTENCNMWLREHAIEIASQWPTYDKI